jgi:hypothetical protein
MIANSPERGMFQIECQLKHVEEGDKTMEEAQTMIDFYKSHRELVLERESQDDWKIDNMEYDLRSTQWIVDKVKASDVYAQHLYAALCNNDFTKNDVWPILTEKKWSCSWRHAGGIVADMQEKGDYIDWYCSGIRDASELDDDQFRQCSKQQQEAYIESRQYVNESVVTDEIAEDLLILGWIVVDSDE